MSALRVLVLPDADEARELAAARVAPAPELLTYADLAARWGFAEAYAKDPKNQTTRLRGICRRLRLKKIVLTGKEIRFRLSDVLKAEEAALRKV